MLKRTVANRHAVVMEYGSTHADGSVKRPTSIAGYYHPSLLRRLWWRVVKRVPLLSKEQAQQIAKMKEGN